MPKGVIQGRCSIPTNVYEQLPEVLLRNGSMLFLTKRVTGFCAVYEIKAAHDNEANDNESFLFWAINLEGAEIEKAKEMASDDARVRFTLDYLESARCEQDGLPKIVKLGNQNVRCGPVSSSSPPVNWRKGVESLGRIIFIGDSIHAMTRESHRQRISAHVTGPNLIRVTSRDRLQPVVVKARIKP